MPGDSTNNLSPNLSENIQGGHVGSYYGDLVTEKLLRRETKERHELLIVVKSARLPVFYAELLQLNAIRGIEDLALIDDEMVDEIVSEVRCNGYKAEVDLENRLMRKKYLGHECVQNKLFTIKRNDRERLLSLPRVAKEYRAGQDEKKKEGGGKAQIVTEPEVVVERSSQCQSEM